MAVKVAIESVDRPLLGVDITIKQCALSVGKGYVKISRLVVHQPDQEVLWERDEHMQLKNPDLAELKNKPGGRQWIWTKNKFGDEEEVEKVPKWKHNYIAKIDCVLVKINLCRVITTLGDEFEVEDLSFHGVHVNIEKPDTNLKCPNSNVEYLLNHMERLGLMPPPEDPLAPKEDKKDEKKAEEEPPKEEPPKEEPKKEEPKKEEPKKADEPAAKEPTIIIRRVVLGDIGAGVCVKGLPMGKELSFHPTIPKFEIKDFHHDVIGERMDRSPGITIALLIMTIVKELFKTVALQIPKQIAAKLKESGKEALGNVAKKASKVLGGACCGGGGAAPQNKGTIADIPPEKSEKFDKA